MHTVKYLFIVIVLSSACQTGAPGDEKHRYHWIEGHWQTEAFSGLLAEQRQIVNSHTIESRAYYMEQGDTTYSEFVRMKKEGDIWTLSAAPQNADTLYFRSTITEDTLLIFEAVERIPNQPFRIIYRYTDNESFSRMTHTDVAGRTEARQYLFRKVVE